MLKILFSFLLIPILIAPVKVYQENHIQNWTGEWYTYWGEGADASAMMFLTQDSDFVNGHYDYQNGEISAKAFHSGDTYILRGDWYQKNSFGWFVFYMSPDGQSFKGEWGYEQNEPSSGFWNGERRE